MPQGPDATIWYPRQRAVLRATDELHAQRQISHATWQPLNEQLGPRGNLELKMLVGHYEMLAGVLNSACLPLEPDTETRLAQVPIH